MSDAAAATTTEPEPERPAASAADAAAADAAVEEEEEEELEHGLEGTPFAGLRLHTHAALRAVRASAGGRAPCARCGHTRLMYCYTCGCALAAAPAPRVALPLRADVWHHRAEHRQKSTALHARILAPADVRLVEYPAAAGACVGAYGPETLLLYPAPDAVDVAALPDAVVAAARRVVVVDSPWQKTGGMLAHPALRGVRRVRIRGAATAFWRHQSHGPGYLSTVEALYWFMREFWARAHPAAPYAGHLDNLLWYFAFNYTVVQQHYRDHPELAFRHIKGYIKYGDGSGGGNGSDDKKAQEGQQQEEDDEEKEKGQQEHSSKRPRSE